MALQIEPADGMVAVEFLDDADEEAEEGYQSPNAAAESGEYHKAVFAMCLGVGKNPNAKPNYKRGDTILVRESARKYAIEVSGETCLVNQYDVVGKVKA